MKTGLKIYNLAKELWGMNRSITGEGVRQTLDVISQYLPNLKIHSVKTGTQVFDWKVPKEWHVIEAYIITPSGDRICDFEENNLHLVGYSVPFNETIPLSELQQHLYSIPEQPEAIPYVTSYYKEHWGFCISEIERNNLQEGNYEVVINSSLFNGVLNYGELIIEGEGDEEVFLSSYICHPSMANNELSGPTVLTFLSKWLEDLKMRRYTYRIVFIPETIGSITYLSKHHQDMREKVIAGFNISCIGDERAYSFLPSRNGNSLSDAIAVHVLKWLDPNYINYSWSDRGSDERQYCAPGIDLPIASIMRTKYGKYPEYHTSLDDLKNVVTPNGLEGGFEALRLSIEAIENNYFPKVTVLGEPHLGSRGLYPTISRKNSTYETKLMMDFITWSDGRHSLLEISEKSNVPIWNLYPLIKKLKSHGLITLENNAE